MSEGEIYHMRIWRSDGDHDGSMHAMGNGSMLAYGRGPEITHHFGPPYSSPNALGLTVVSDGIVTDEAEREPGTAIWRHRLQKQGREVLSFTEFTAADIPAYVRLFDVAQGGVDWLLRPHQAAGLQPCADLLGVWLLVVRPGTPFYSFYPSNNWSFHWLIPGGACELAPTDGGLLVRCLPGQGSLTVVGSVDYPGGKQDAEQVLEQGAEALLAPARRYWRDFTARRLAARPIPPGFPKTAEGVLDGTAVMIKAQQSTDGGIMAGHHYALAYQRDQYGAARGMLALGMLEEARANLMFRRRKFEIFGSLQNAEAMGTDCARHIHENDEVEAPGYAILQARDYLAATGDEAFGLTLWPMLTWCWEVQQKHLAGGMLPFNGDETYVAGGFFPRTGLLHGSADSTLVFAEGGRWLAAWAERQGLWTAGQVERARASIGEARAAYRRHFWAGDRLWANEPARADMVKPPRFRHGVCEGWQGGKCRWFGWTERNRHGRYACPSCLEREDLVAAAPGRLEVNSVSLLPVYLGSDVLTPEELGVLAERALAQELASGHIPSVPGSKGCVGFDPGLLLLTLTVIAHPAAERAYERLLRMFDATGAWNEYYEEDDTVRKGCCRARPYESGMNVDAFVNYLAARK